MQGGILAPVNAAKRLVIAPGALLVELLVAPVVTGEQPPRQSGQ